MIGVLLVRPAKLVVNLIGVADIFPDSKSNEELLNNEDVLMQIRRETIRMRSDCRQNSH